MGSESKAHEAEGRMGAIESETMKAGGIIVLVKSNQLVKKDIETKHLSQAKARLQSFFAIFLQTWPAAFATSGL